MPLNTMVIGCGAAAHKLYHKPLKKLTKTDDLRITALVDTHVQHACSMRSYFPHANVYEHVAEALEACPPEVTIVLSPAHLHFQHTIQALESNSHVLCEKPMATSVAECTGMVDAARKFDRVFALGMVRRFFPAFATLKKLLESDILGELDTFEYREGKRFDWDVTTPAGFLSRQHGGAGVLFDIGPHAIDLLIWLFGVPQVLSAEDDALAGVESNVSLQLRMPSCSGLLQLSWNCPLANDLRVRGTRGEAVLRLDRFDKLAINTTGNFRELPCDYRYPVDTLRVPHRRRTPLLYSDAIHCQLIQMIRAIRWGEPPAVDGETGRQCVAVMEDALRIVQPLDMTWLSQHQQERFRELHRSHAL